MAEPSILIVGAGIFGTSTAYHLAKTYKDVSGKVTVIDRSPSPPKPAASIDVNRIIRTDYGNELYCNLAYEAIHSWFWDLELQSYFHQIGWVSMDKHGNDLTERVREVFRARGYDHTEDVPLDNLGERWQGLQGTDTSGFKNAYFSPDAGWCNAAGATGNFMEAAIKRGVKRITADVKELLFDGSQAGRITGVRTADGQHFSADKIVLASGAWTSSLLAPVEEALEIAENDRIESQVKAVGQVSAYFKMSAEEVERTSKMPIICYGGTGEVIPPSMENKTLKFTNYRTFLNTVETKSGHKISMPFEGNQDDVPEKLKQETEELVTSRLAPELTRGKKADHWRICWDSWTPTQDLLMCQHPHRQLSNLYIAAGGNFHGYKFLPNAGKYMLNVLNGQSNGPEKDKAWGWKTSREERGRRVHEKATPRRELRDLEEVSVDRARL